MSADTTVRISSDSVERLRDAASRHPLKPTLRRSIERGIELVIIELEGKANDRNPA